jgi:hypothetical protein
LHKFSNYLNQAIEKNEIKESKKKIIPSMSKTTVPLTILQLVPLPSHTPHGSKTAFESSFQSHPTRWQNNDDKLKSYLIVKLYSLFNKHIDDCKSKKKKMFKN